MSATSNTVQERMFRQHLWTLSFLWWTQLRRHAALLKTTLQAEISLFISSFSAFLHAGQIQKRQTRNLDSYLQSDFPEAWHRVICVIENRMVAAIISLRDAFVVFDEVQLGTNLAETLHPPHKAVV